MNPQMKNAVLVMLGALEQQIAAVKALVGGVPTDGSSGFTTVPAPAAVPASYLSDKEEGELEAAMAAEAQSADGQRLTSMMAAVLADMPESDDEEV